MISPQHTIHQHTKHTDTTEEKYLEKVMSNLAWEDRFRQCFVSTETFFIFLKPGPEAELNPSSLTSLAPLPDLPTFCILKMFEILINIQQLIISFEFL